MSNPIDEHFKKGLESLEVKPSAHLWQQKIAPQMQPKQKKAVIWYRAAAVVVLLLSGWYTMNFTSNYKSTETSYPEFPLVEETVKPNQIEQAKPSVKPVAAKVDLAEVSTKTVVSTSNKNEQKQQKTEVASIAGNTEIPVVENTMVAVVERPKVKVRLHLNTANYLDEEVQVAQQITEESSIKAYAKNQWQNIKNGDKLEAPSVALLDLPKFAVRFEGNPLKRILNP